MAVQIDKDVPIPGIKRKSSSAYSIALEEMKVGDSFVIEDENVTSAYSGIRQAAARLGIKITARKTENGKMRVWKVADKDGE